MAVKKKEATSAQDLDRIIVRLPDGMRDKIAELAEANGRSMTSEVVAALEQHLTRPDRMAALEAFIERYREEIEGLASLSGKVEDLESTVDKLEEFANDTARSLRNMPG